MGAAPYEVTKDTEVPYLFANGVRLGRVVYEEGLDVGVGDMGTLRVFFELGDHLGSTDVVLDKATGELVEKSTTMAYGAPESDYRPGRWKDFREDYRFTGKEEDVEVGLVYFGKRYYAPLLGRWVSPDPLELHSPGEADGNLYAYVRGQALRLVDPLGLQSAGGAGGCTGEGGSEGAGNATPPEQDQAPPPRAEPSVSTEDEGGSAALAPGGPIAAAAAKGAQALARKGIQAGLKIVLGIAAVGAAIGAGIWGFSASGDSSRPNSEKDERATPPTASDVKEEAPQTETGGDGAQKPPGRDGPAVAAGDEPPINSRKLRGHVPGTPEHRNRIKAGKSTSTFRNESEARQLTRQAWQNGTQIDPKNPNIRLYDVGRPIGVGPRGGGYQTQVRVSIDSKGTIHGSPFGRVFQGPLPPSP